MSKERETEVTLPPKSATERQLENVQLQAAQLQLDAFRRQQAFQQQLLQDLGPLISGLEGDATRARERQERLAPIEDELLQLELDRIRRGGAASPEQIDLIRQATEAALEAGQSDINRATEQNLELLREELAPRLGLRSSDSPILDRGARVAEEGTRQIGQLSRNLRGAEATARLNFPLAVDQLVSSQTQFQQQLQEGARQFQEQLRQQAFANRLALTGQTGNLGLGLSGIGNFGASALGGLQNLRLGSASTLTTERDPVGQAARLLAGIGTFAAGVRGSPAPSGNPGGGGGGGGAEAAAAGGGGSDPRLKSNVRHIGTRPDGLNVYEWTWNRDAIEAGFGSQPTVGFMAPEVEQVYPDAVLVGPDGYQRVKYGEIPHG